MPQVVGFVASAFGATAGTFAAGTGLAAGAAAGSAFFGTSIGQLVLGVGLSLVSRALAPKPAVPKPADRMANFAQPIAYAETVYGRARKGGPIGFTGYAKTGVWENDTTGEVAHFLATDDPASGWTRVEEGGRRRFYAPILAAHPIEGVVEHWLDERQVTLGADGRVADTDAAGYGWIRVYDGQAGQAADSSLVNIFTGWTSAHDMAGLSYAVIAARRAAGEAFSDVYPQGRQWDYTPVIDGHDQIHDPRGGGSTGFSRNAALILQHWIVNRLGRTGLSDAELAVEADICDQAVTTRYEGTIPRWRIDGVLSDEQDFEDQRAQLVAACDAFLFERPDGSVGFRVGRYSAPTVTLTARDFYGIEIAEGDDGPDAPTEVKPTYVEPGNAWRESPAGAWVIESATIPRTEEPQLYLVASHNQASRLAKRIAKARRPAYRLRGTLGLIGYDLIGERFLRVTHAEMALDEVFEVSQLTREGPATFTLEAQSVAPADFDFDAAAEEPDRPDLGATPEEDAGDTALNPTAANVNSDSGLALVRVSWDAIGADEHVSVRWREVGETAWSEQAAPRGERELTFFAPDGVTLEIQAQPQIGFRNAPLGDWEPDPALSLVTVADDVGPAALTAAAAYSGAGVLGLSDGAALALASGQALALRLEDAVLVTWTAPNDRDFRGVQVWRATGSVNFGDATLVRTQYGPASAAQEWLEDGLSAATHAYWIEPINGSGVAGTRAGPLTITTT